MSLTPQQQVFDAIRNERSFQDAKWGTPEQHPHEVGGWLTIMRQLLNEAEQAWMNANGDAGALDGIRKATAVGVACMEQHGAPPRQTCIAASQT